MIFAIQWNFHLTDKIADFSSYRVGGTKAFFSKCSLTKPNYISTFHLMAIILLNLYVFYLMVIFYGNLYMFISCGTERIFPFDEIYMFLFHVETNAFSIAWLHTTGSLSRNTGSYTEKQVWTCLVKTGNESSLIAIVSRSSDSSTISHQPIKNVPINYFFR